MRKLLWISLAVLAMGTMAAGCTIDDTYASCFDDSDCNDLDDQCIEVDLPSVPSFGGFCSYACSSHFDCESAFGFDGRCYSIGGTEVPICFQGCVDDFDCYSGNICVDAIDPVSGTVDFICVPDN